MGTSTSLPVDDPEPDTAIECPVCRNLNYLPSAETNDDTHLKDKMTRLNLTETTTPDPAESPEEQASSPPEPQYPNIPSYAASAKDGCRCCAFVYILYSIAVQLIKQHSFTTVNGWGMGATDKDIHALVFRVHGTLRLRLTNVKWLSREGRDLEWDVYTLES